MVTPPDRPAFPAEPDRRDLMTSLDAEEYGALLLRERGP
jgi:hypothetical protein